MTNSTFFVRQYFFSSLTHFLLTLCWQQDKMRWKHCLILPSPRFTSCDIFIFVLANSTELSWSCQPANQPLSTIRHEYYGDCKKYLQKYANRLLNNVSFFKFMLQITKPALFQSAVVHISSPKIVRHKNWHIPHLNRVFDFVLFPFAYFQVIYISIKATFSARFFNLLSDPMSPHTTSERSVFGCVPRKGNFEM